MLLSHLILVAHNVKNYFKTNKKINLNFENFNEIISNLLIPPLPLPGYTTSSKLTAASQQDHGTIEYQCLSMM